MAQVLPAKRPQALTDHYGGLSRGAAGPSRSKRPRSSIAPSERSCSDDESTAPDDGDTSSNTPDYDEDDAAYLRATQVVEKSLRNGGTQQNTPAEAGIIEEIRCTNFMCHEQLTVTLGPLINFIIGHNGSGKSAVLTALTLCLGGKATATNRGQNLKSFIKEGRDSCTLSVKIKNQGSTAYKAEQYGDSIIVERHFNRSGASGFKLKDRNGKIVSTKKADLEDIIDAFAMQIDNPMNVLTQDMARQFLNDSGPKEKYKFFLKGTQLETLSRDYAQIGQELEEQESRAQTLQSDLDVYRKNFEEAYRKAKRAQNLEKMRAKELALAHQAAWAKVAAEENGLANTEHELDQIAGVINERSQEADKQSELYARADHTLEAAKAAVAECQAENQSAEAEYTECKQKFEGIKNTIRDLKAEERRIAATVKASKNSVEATQTQLQNFKDQQAKADDGVHAEQIRRYEEAKAKFESCRAAWENHGQILPTLTGHLNAARDQKVRVQEKLNQKRQEEAESRRKIGALERGQRKWIDAYPNPGGLEKLIRAIESEGRFRERPVGPMGRYVELMEPEWGYILEKQFGSALNAFVVTSKADQSILSELSRRNNYHVPILISNNPAPIDTSGYEPDKKLLTWMRALKISNDLVRNQLIINQSIDQVVLIRRRSEAQAFMDRNGPERRNVKMCFCMSDLSRRLGHTITINQQSGASSLAPIDEFKGNLRMQADKGPQIQEEKDNLATISRQLREIEAEVGEAQNKINACQARIEEHRHHKRTLKIDMDQAQENMDQLEDQMNSSVDTARIEQLEKELDDQRQQLELNEDQYQDFTIQKDNADEEARASKRQLEAAHLAFEEAKRRLDKANAKIQTLSQRREVALRSKNEALAAVEEAETNQQEWEKRREEQCEAVRSIIRDAESICHRVEVPPNETFESLMKKIDRLKEEREQSERELGGSEEDLLRRANEAKKTYKDAEAEMKGTEKVRTVLKMAMKTRNERWHRFRQEISVRARVTFNYLLSERQFRGSMSVDHSNQKLDIHIQPDITVTSNVGRQTKTLSGGEKSFSTICLLLALWDAMGSPIRCLDEFDVFMDSVNREVSMRLMIGAARRAIGRQYILITPQAMGNAAVGNANDVKIIRMRDPVRGQTALNFGR